MVQVPEKVSVVQFKTYLRFLENKGILMFTRITTQGKMYGNGAAARFIPNTDMKGHYDFTINTLPVECVTGITGYWEAKSSTGKLTKNQLKFKERMDRFNIPNGYGYQLIQLQQFLVDKMKLNMKDIAW